MGPRREIYLKLLDDGLSYADIAEKCGVSRQTVYASVMRYERRNKPKYSKSYIKGVENQVVYVGVADYLLDHDMSVTALARKCSVSPAVMLRLMKGEQELKKHHIDAIIAVTGLSYERLFKED